MELLTKEWSDRILASYLCKVSTRSKIIYWVIIIVIVTVLLCLPLIYVDVAVRSRGFFSLELRDKQSWHLAMAR